MGSGWPRTRCWGFGAGGSLLPGLKHGHQGAASRRAWPLPSLALVATALGLFRTQPKQASTSLQAGTCSVSPTPSLDWTAMLAPGMLNLTGKGYLQTTG